MTLTIAQRATLLALCRREADERESQYYLLSRTYGDAHPDTERARREWDEAKGLWDALHGAAPDATGDLSSEDFVRRKREEDWR